MGDPRAGEPTVVPFHIPRHWTSTSDYFSTIATAMGGLAMVGKQPIAAWLAVVAAFLGVMNSKPLTQKKGKDGAEVSPWSALAMGGAGILGCYIPRLMIPARDAATQAS